LVTVKTEIEVFEKWLQSHILQNPQNLN
jgi:hypothetical protein